MLTSAIWRASGLAASTRQLLPPTAWLANPGRRLVLFASWLADPTPGPGIPNPGFGTAPPGSDKVLTILGWAAWGVTAACVGGILFVAIKMAMSIRRGEFSEHAMGLGSVLFACILGGSAFGIVGALWA